MTSPAERMIQRAKDVVDNGKPVEHARHLKLYKRIAADEALWLSTFEALFRDITWAMEVTSLGLNKNEILAVASVLKQKGIEGVQLNTPEAYKALVISALQSWLRELKRALREGEQAVIDKMNMVCRFEETVVIVSGYRYGLPTTTYVSADDFFHHTYSDALGAFQEEARAANLTITKSEPLFRSIVELERNMDLIRKLWSHWKAIGSLAHRIENLEKYSDTQGAFA